MRNIKSRNLTSLLRDLQNRLSEIQSYELISELDDIRTTYSTMLHYMLKGVEDPNSSNIYNDLVRRCHILLDRSKRLQRISQNNTDKYVTTFKSLPSLNLQQIINQLSVLSSSINELKEHPNSRASIQEYSYSATIESHQSTLSTIFKMLWTGDVLSKSDFSSLLSLLESSEISTYDKSIVVSGITLGLLEMFDVRKLMYLFDSYESNIPEIRMRAIVGIVLCLREHNLELRNNPTIESRLSLLYDSPSFIEDMYLIMMQLQYSKLTNKVSDKMRNDIIPSLLRSGKFKRSEFGLQEIDDYMTRNGENPEWHKKGKSEDAYDKLQEIASLQMEGADIYMSTFQYMKSNRFFHEISNWFMPFSTDHPLLNEELSKIKNIPSSMHELLNYAPFCNSDKYSFVFMLSQTGEKGIEMISNSISNEMDESDLKEHIKDMRSESKKRSDISRQYIHDLYRFFMLYPFRHQFNNPFSEESPSFTPLSHDCFTPLKSSESSLLQLGEFLMRKEIYTDALDIFNYLSSSQSTADASIWQKIGFCYQKLGLLNDSHDSYTKAYTIDPESQWTIKHLAFVCMQLKEYEECEAYYDLLLLEDDENITYLKRKAKCQIYDSRYDEALPILYKLYYLEEESKEIRSDLAFCLLMTGKFEKSKALYHKLIIDYPEDSYLLMQLGNCYYMTGDKESAYSYYRSSLSHIENQDILKFKQMFVESSKELKSQGINVKQFEMMYDSVCLNIE